MDELTRYRHLIIELMREHAQHRPSHGDIQVELIIDEAQDHYELIYAGWSGKYRIHGSVIHVDIRDGKVWIQHDGTEDGIAEDLVEAGVPRDRIVLAFKSPAMRQHTGFAVA
jgi:ketopantoate reductase